MPFLNQQRTNEVNESKMTVQKKSKTPKRIPELIVEHRVSDEENSALNEFEKVLDLMEKSSDEKQSQQELDCDQQRDQFKMMVDTFVAAVNVFEK